MVFILFFIFYSFIHSLNGQTNFLQLSEEGKTLVSAFSFCSLKTNEKKTKTKEKEKKWKPRIAISLSFEKYFWLDSLNCHVTLNKSSILYENEKLRQQFFRRFFFKQKTFICIFSLNEKKRDLSPVVVRLSALTFEKKVKKKKTKEMLGIKFWNEYKWNSNSKKKKEEIWTNKCTKCEMVVRKVQQRNGI